MIQLKRFKWFFAILFIVISCRDVDQKDFDDISIMLKDMSKNPMVEYNTYPPKLVKAFLKFEKNRNDALIDLLGLTSGFTVVNINTINNRKYYNKSLSNVRFQIKKDGFVRVRSINFEEIEFRQFICEYDGGKAAIVIEIQEPGMYTIYYLNGTFTKEDILETNKNVSPVEFLKLNRKIRQK